MIALYYIAFLAIVFVLLKTPLLGKLLHHGIQHLISHYCHNVKKSVTVLATFLWLMLLAIPACIFFGWWYSLLADVATLGFLYAFCNQHH